MCERSYKHARDYRAHVAAHKDGSIYRCDICACVMSTSSDYLKHLKVSDLITALFCQLG